MTSYRTLTIAAALALSALAAQAESPLPRDGDWSNHSLTATEAPSTLTREAVVADLVASRQAGTLPRAGEWYNVPAPLGFHSGTALARDAEPVGAMTAAKSRTPVSSEQ